MSIRALVLSLMLGMVTPGLIVSQLSAQVVAAPVEDCGDVDSERLSEAVEALRRIHAKDGSVFVEQAELDPLISDGGGGSCASCVAINAIQILRSQLNLSPLSNPHKVALGAFAAHPRLLRGRVRNSQLMELLSYYQKYTDGRTFQVKAQVAPGYLDDGELWSQTDGPKLDVTAGTLKILSYSVIALDGKERGRHFVLLKSHNNNQIAVVDFVKPAKDRRYILERRDNDVRAHSDIYLLQPPDAPRRTDTYRLNTVFTVSPENKAVTLSDLKATIDLTSERLRRTGDFISPRVWRKQTATAGLPALDLPQKYGGLNWPPSKMLEVFKHAGRHNLNLRDVVGGAHVRPLLKSNHPSIRKIVEQVARGEGYIAIAITEPDVGSNVTGIKSTARKVNGGYLLSGTKRFNARLDQASHVIVFTQSASSKPGKLSVFVLPMDTPGLEVERLKAHGLLGNSYGGLRFKDLFVPHNQLIGEDGEGMSVFFEHFIYWRLMQTAAAIGTGEQALEQMAERLKSREAFGRPIGRFTHLQQPLGQHHTELQMAYSLAKEAAGLLDEGDYAGARSVVAGLKAEGVEISLNAVDAATRAFGGEGYSDRVDLDDRLRDLNGLRIADGTTDVMRMEVVRQVYGEDLWDMAVTHSE